MGARQATHRGRTLLMDGEIDGKEKEAMAVLAEARPIAASGDDAVDSNEAIDEIFEATGSSAGSRADCWPPGGRLVN